MNPNVEKKKVRPYLSKGFRTGTDLALWFTGLTAGAFHKRLNCMVKGALCLLRVRVIGSEKTTSYSKSRIGISPFFSQEVRLVSFIFYSNLLSRTREQLGFFQLLYISFSMF